MGVYDRPWLRDGELPRARWRLTVVNGLVIANVAVYVLQVLVFRRSGALLYEFGLWPSEVLSRFAVWQLVTSLFIHDPTSPLHLIFNMLVLYGFGPRVESQLGRVRFAVFYFACGLCASAAYVLLGPLTGLLTVAVGASGAILGTLVYHTMLDPDAPVLVFWLVPTKMKWATVTFIAIDLFAFALGSVGEIAHTAHLGGAAGGLAWFILERRGVLRRGPKKKPRRAPAAAPESDAALGLRVDGLLDKIRDGGLDSLTSEERDFLRDASRRMRH